MVGSDHGTQPEGLDDVRPSGARCPSIRRWSPRFACPRPASRGSPSRSSSPTGAWVPRC